MTDGPRTGDLAMTYGASRRRILQGAAAWSAIAALADFALTAECALAGETSEGTEPFAPDLVRKLAEELAGREFAKPHIEVPEPFNALTPEQYRDIRFRPEATIWRGEKLDYEIQLLPLGWLYDMPVDLWIVEGGKARKLKADSTVFSARRIDRERPPGGALRPLGLPHSGAPQSRRSLRRLRRLPGRELLQGARPRPAVRTLGARARHQHGARRRRGVSDLPRLLDRAAGSRARPRSSSMRFSTASPRPAPTASDPSRPDDRDGRRRRALSAPRADPRRLRAADQHVPARLRESARRSRLFAPPSTTARGSRS